MEKLFSRRHCLYLKNRKNREPEVDKAGGRDKMQIVMITIFNKKSLLFCEPGHRCGTANAEQKKQTPEKRSESSG